MIIGYGELGLQGNSAAEIVRVLTVDQFRRPEMSGGSLYGYTNALFVL